ncbi:helix-turn-helix domain-containing protein, partial [Stappia taiwanensis]|uniref:helix-turn-helix domain-containing protein n=1 Tax=Stappia taiwanensis TaxID=992267 RepID=UPI001AD8A318
ISHIALICKKHESLNREPCGMHPLTKWRSERNLTRAEAAKIIGCKAGTIADWEYRRRFPSPGSITRIVKATDGDVTANDLHTGYRLPDEAAE